MALTSAASTVQLMENNASSTDATENSVLFANISSISNNQRQGRRRFETFEDQVTRFETFEL